MGVITFGSDPRCGWHPIFAERSKERMAAQGHSFRAVRPLAKPTAPISLTQYRYRWLNQGAAGTCWLNSPVIATEWTAKALGLDVFPICRRLVGWAGKQMEGGGNPSDGGSGFDAYQAMTQSNGGVGLAHESLAPYTDDYRTLGTKPDASVFADAKTNWLDTPLSLPDLDTGLGLLPQNHPFSIGIWWPRGWGDSNYLMKSVGPGEYGHEVTVTGYAPAGVLAPVECVEITNQWGLIYPPLPPELAALIPGYLPATPTATDGFWTYLSNLGVCIAKGNAEITAVTSMGSLAVNFIDLDGFNVF